ncbi:PepSY domain-containing protein [Nocardioides seonyuensis]|uniref:PepSY domain-containing protein n=1 Tax=Nocardioides seonyuensis TaxID=2518371 RepID=A0A4P7IIT6_9ACTN|nr:PepSY domain-containing protein [Nocardioides seonyuensis]QBX57278.1 PepSY domain-containing protein [Nocardioides seonyuensis]
MTQLDPRPPAQPAPPRSQARARSGGWFRAVWRWHFFASIVVVPVLLVLATTGLIYLFRFQLEPLLHPDLFHANQPAGMDFTQPYSAQLDAAERAYPDATLLALAEPRTEERATVITAEMPDGSPREIFVNPWGADVLGSLNPDTTLSGYAVRLHADLMSGVWGDRLMELGACWALVTALLGYYLFWRGRRARSRKPKTLRSWHARIGAVAGVGLVTLLVSGLPWTGFWGAQVQELATNQGTSMWSLDHGAESNPASTLDESLPHSHAVPWGSGKTEVPQSDDEGHEGAVANVDTAIEVAAGEGLRHPMTVALPDGDDGVFSAIGYAFDAPSDEQTVHVDRFGGEVVSTYGYDDYPLLAKVVAQGIGLHEGRSLGLVTFWASALMCGVIIASCVTGPLMWWRRRRGAGLDAPRGRMPVAGSPWLLAGLVVLGVLLPFFGVTLLAVLVFDQLVVRRLPVMTRWLGAQ